MREIKYRGKVNGSWWYVVAFKNGGPSSKWEQFWAIVDEKTVGEYIALNDKNGKEIFEGDVVKVLYSDFVSVNDFKMGEIIFQLSEFRASFVEYGGSLVVAPHGYIEVVGNVYENPELVKKIRGKK